MLGTVVKYLRIAVAYMTIFLKVDVHRKILLIGQNIGDLWIAKRFFDGKGYDLLILCDPDDLVEHVHVFRPGVIFIDAADLFGTEAEKILDTDPFCKCIPLIKLLSHRCWQAAGKERIASDKFTYQMWLEEIQQKADSIFDRDGLSGSGLSKPV